MIEFVRAIALLLMLLNPFLVILYLVDLIEKVSFGRFVAVLVRASIISVVVFVAFATLGDFIFSDIIQARFASFQMFGGVVFLLIGVQFVFKGVGAVEVLRGDSEGITGAIVMPVLVGPGTISASVIIGKRLYLLNAAAAIGIAVGVSTIVMILLKLVYDCVKSQGYETVIHRYIEIAGRIMALYVGTISVDMIMQGMRSWIQSF